MSRAYYATAQTGELVLFDLSPCERAGPELGDRPAAEERHLEIPAALPREEAGRTAVFFEVSFLSLFLSLSLFSCLSFHLLCV